MRKNFRPSGDYGTTSIERNRLVKKEQEKARFFASHKLVRARLAAAKNAAQGKKTEPKHMTYIDEALYAGGSVRDGINAALWARHAMREQARAQAAQVAAQVQG
jgi:hypothetical protein